MQRWNGRSGLIGSMIRKDREYRIFFFSSLDKNMIFQVIRNFNFSFSRVEFAGGSFDSILITVCKKCVFDALLGVGNCDRKYSNGFCSVRDLERVHIVIIGGDKRWTGG